MLFRSDFFLAGIWIAVQQNLGSHDHAVGAVAALSSLLIDERSLQRVRFLGGTQSLERDDLIFADVPQGGRACPCEFSPPTMAAQAPHCPRPQPNFGPFSPRSFLSTYSSGVSGAASTTCCSPFTAIRYDISHPAYERNRLHSGLLRWPGA